MAKERTMINDLTQGRVMGKLIRFTLPLMLANLLQVCYNLVDMFFVGQFAGTDALSAVSIASNVTVLMFFCFMGTVSYTHLYRGVGQPHQVKGGQAAAEVALHPHPVALDALEAQRVHADNHFQIPPVLNRVFLMIPPESRLFKRKGATGPNGSGKRG